jgi:Zn-dependent protease
VTAQRHGFWAEFRLSPFGLILSLVTAAVGFLFAAPGATLVAGIGEHDAGNWGRTSLAGPMSNLAFATAFYGASIGASYALPAWVGPLLFLAFINAWFGTFNLVPVGPLDGAKVLRWSTAVWVLALVGTAAATVVSYLAYFGGAGPALGL